LIAVRLSILQEAGDILTSLDPAQWDRLLRDADRDVRRQSRRLFYQGFFADLKPFEALYFSDIFSGLGVLFLLKSFGSKKTRNGIRAISPEIINTWKGDAFVRISIIGLLPFMVSIMPNSPSL